MYIDDMINTLDFRNKSEIAVSGGFLKVKPKVNKKYQEKLAQVWFHCLFAFRWIGYPIQKLEIPNSKFEIPN